MPLDEKLVSIRTSARKKFKVIMDHLIHTKISRLASPEDRASDICSFCASTENLTKEHVIPQWVYEGSVKNFFITKMNELGQTYNKTTIPACSECNNNNLSALEKHLTDLFSKIKLPAEFFSDIELANIIRWLEIIEYKFQVLNARRVFLTHKEKGYIESLSDLPLTVMRNSVDYNPFRAVKELRSSLRRITVKNKNQYLNSLIIFKTSNKSLHFFHKMDDFIFLEIPQFQIAVFYFFNRTFDTNLEAQKEAWKIIKEVYN